MRCLSVSNVDKGIRRKTHKKMPQIHYKVDPSGIGLHFHDRGIVVKVLLRSRVRRDGVCEKCRIEEALGRQPARIDALMIGIWNCALPCVCNAPR